MPLISGELSTKSCKSKVFVRKDRLSGSLQQAAAIAFGLTMDELKDESRMKAERIRVRVSGM